MKFVYSVLLLLILNISFGQESSQTNFRNQLKFSPTRLINDIRGIQFSYERIISKKFSTQLTSAYIVDAFANTNLATWKKLNGFSAGLEQKYFHKQTKYFKNYIAADFTFLTCKFEDEGRFGYQYPKDSIEYPYQYTDTFNLKKTTYTFSLKYGIQLMIERLVMDVNIGLGIRYRDVVHSNRNNYNDFMEMPRHPNLEYLQTVNGKYFSVNIPFDFKVGYSF